MAARNSELPDTVDVGHLTFIPKSETQIMGPARWPRLMNRETVAEYLSVSARHVDTLISQGLIPAPRFRPSARLVRWDKEEIDAALNHRDQVNCRGGKSFDEVMGASVAMISNGKRGGR